MTYLLYVGIEKNLVPQILIEKIHDIFLFNLLLIPEIPLVLHVPPNLIPKILSQSVILHPLAYVKHVFFKHLRRPVEVLHFLAYLTDGEGIDSNRDELSHNAVNTFVSVNS